VPGEAQWAKVAGEISALILVLFRGAGADGLPCAELRVLQQHDQQLRMMLPTDQRRRLFGHRLAQVVLYAARTFAGALSDERRRHWRSSARSFQTAR